MNTPICDFVRKYAAENKTRLHMPGHKGKEYIGCEKNDITEFDGADVLYSASGIIAESQKNASELFGTEKTLYSTEGSSLCIRAMVYLIKLTAELKGEKAKILAFRNAHKTFITACAVLGVDIEWLYGEKNEGITCCNITVEYLRKEISALSKKPTAIYVTSPDYLGNIVDIKGIAELCKEKGILLAVDNAHGAYLNFLPENKHPIYLGADICCDSAHKTLPVLTGGAYLHISENAPKLLKDKAQYALSLFASTSPSYLIMQSLDSVNMCLSKGYRERLDVFCNKLSAVKERLEKYGYSFIGEEALKLTIKAKEYGYKGTEIGEHLLRKGIVCEFCDPDYVVMMFTPENTDTDLSALEKALKALPKKEAIREIPPSVTKPEKVYSLSEALYLPTGTVDIKDSLGLVMGSVSVSCPPAVPIVIMGERIGEKEIALFDYYGVKECEIINI